MFLDIHNLIKQMLGAHVSICIWPVGTGKYTEVDHPRGFRQEAKPRHASRQCRQRLSYTSNILAVRWFLLMLSALRCALSGLAFGKPSQNACGNIIERAVLHGGSSRPATKSSPSSTVASETAMCETQIGATPPMRLHHPLTRSSSLRCDRGECGKERTAVHARIKPYAHIREAVAPMVGAPRFY